MGGRRSGIRRGARSSSVSRIARARWAKLASEFPVSRPAVSQHLKVLKDAGLVTSSRDGNRRIYQADPRGVAAMRDQLDRFWNQALATFKEVVEQDTQEVS